MAMKSRTLNELLIEAVRRTEEGTGKEARGKVCRCVSESERA